MKVTSKKTQFWIILSLFILIAFFAVFNSNLWYFRLDLTSDQIYTISNISKDLVSTLEDELKIEYFVSGKIANQAPQFRTIIDLLYEYARFSNGKISVTITDTDSSEQNLQLEQYGLQAQSIPIREGNTDSFLRVYTGIVISYLDKTAVLPFVTNPGNLEYSLTTNINNLITNDTRILGIVFGSQVSPEQNYTVIKQFMGQFAEVRTYGPGELIPSDVDSLFVLGSSSLTREQLFPIDQFLMEGKGVLFAVDPVDVNFNQGWLPVPQPDQDLLLMLKDYGVEVQNNWVYDANSLIIQNPNSSSRQPILNYTLWLDLASTGFNPQHPVSSRMGDMSLFWSSSLKYPEMEASPMEYTSGEQNPGETNIQESGLTYIPLIYSSVNSIQKTDQFQTDPEQAFYALQIAMNSDQSADQDPGPYVLAVAASGSVESSFDTGSVPAEFQDSVNFQPSTDKAMLIVVGDSDFSSDVLQLTQRYANLTFLQNAFEWLSADSAFLEIRTRSLQAPSLDAIQIEEERILAEQMALVFIYVLLPGIPLLIGLLRRNWRKSKALTHVTDLSKNNDQTKKQAQKTASEKGAK